MEIEIKKIIENPSGFSCVFCAEPATRIVKIGQVQNFYGTDFDLCNKFGCLEYAEESYVDQNSELKRAGAFEACPMEK